MAFRAFATVVALLLSACSATTSLPVAQLTPTPPERVTWKDSIAADAGTLLIARDAGLHGSAARVFVAVDGIAAGDVRVEEVLKLQVDPGRKVVSALRPGEWVIFTYFQIGSSMQVRTLRRRYSSLRSP